MLGPKILTFVNSESLLKKSTIPLTRGFSGPTTTNSMLFFITKSLISLKSLIFKYIFSAIFCVPAFPGATNSFVHNLLFEIFHANACSRPPEPNKSIFIIQKYYLNSIYCY